MEVTVVDTIKRTYVDSKVGEIKLKDAVLDQDWITMYFNVESFPEEAQRQIDKAIEKKAIEKYQKEEEKYREYGITLDNLKMKEGDWKVLSLSLDSGEFNAYFLLNAVDTKAEKLEVDVRIDANVENFYEEIKNIIFKAIETKYFGQSRKKSVNQIS
jgi:hypothetical protein